MAEISEPRKLSLVEMKARAQAKTEHDKENARIKRDILVLTLEFLRNNGYIDSCQRLQSESGISLAKWQVSVSSRIGVDASVPGSLYTHSLDLCGNHVGIRYPFS